MKKNRLYWNMFLFGTLLFLICNSIGITNKEGIDVDSESATPVNLSAAFSNLFESSDPLELGLTVIIRVDVSDPQGWKEVVIEYEGTNYSMTNIPGTDTWEYNWTPSGLGIHPYTIYSRFNENKWNMLSNSITVVSDATPPTYQLIEKPKNGIKVGERIKIKLEVKDSHGIKQVYLLFDMVNYTMEQLPDTDFWEYEFAAPKNIGVYTYTIYMEDTNSNLNTYTATLEVTNGTSETPAREFLIWIPVIAGAFGVVLGAVAVKSRKSNRQDKSTRETLSKKLKKPTKISHDVERKEVSVTCPICKIKFKILVPVTVINGSKQLTTVSIPANKGCEHHYQVFLDKNFVVRGYQKVDYEFDPEELDDLELIQEKGNQNNNIK
ncbi:MAG: hypothetical protein EU548_06815 [Promethearchaeota archaeon]|nr:MAG: hypothetical protein EU548_06815 [Candidatus Lokiarchaeota archaeon]